MRANDVRYFQQTRPFEPFVIHLADGRSFEIRHPDVVAIPARTRSITVLNQDRLHERINLLMIVSLRPIHPKQLKKKP